MAGGNGTRIAGLFPNIPKPLIPISDANGVSKPVLEWEIMSLVSQGYKDIVLTVSYRADQIQKYFGDGNRWGAHIQYYVEETSLGNAGALFKLRPELTEDFLLLNADSVFDVDFNRMVQWHRNKNALATLFTHPNNHPYDSGIILSDKKSIVHQWLNKEDKRPEYYKNRVNAGLHVISPKVLDMAATTIDVERIGAGLKVDLDRQVLKPLCGTGKMFSYDSPEYVKDMGTPERYRAVSSDFRNGVVQAKNLSHQQKAIFMDRDGTVNQYVGFLRTEDQLELLPGAAEAIKQINMSGYLAIIITNQPVIARGEVTVEQLEKIHNKLETLLGAKGAYIDGLYYCPHHPDSGFEGEVVELKIKCDCRKPKPGLLIKGAQDFNIDLKSSWMIGDGENDVKAGRSAGCRTIRLGEEADSLLDAVNIILCR